jgi:multiple sugar transport system permease protein
MDEAAWMDGASRLQAMRHVILPLAIPGVIVTALFAFIALWNEFLYASSILRSGDAKTLPVGLWQLISEAGIYWGQLTAGGVLAMLPVVVLFVVFQTYIVRGLTQGAVKG